MDASLTDNSQGDVVEKTNARSVKTIEAGFVESFEQRYSKTILETLLCDRTTGKNIIWADDEYAALGKGYEPESEITVDAISGTNSGVIKPRVAKEQERQTRRTRARAEVFTPSWLVNKMNNVLDDEWFGQTNVFNQSTESLWIPSNQKIEFPKKKGFGWHDYVNSLRLEITCGEAPFLCSRYDTVTGEVLPVQSRMGILDRKLRVVDERARSYSEWAKWAFAALQATYGYEYQGDNLFIARINVFETFTEHCVERWKKRPEDSDLSNAAWIVSWNIWQMNGLTCAVPTSQLNASVESTLNPQPENTQLSLFDLLDEPENSEKSSKKTAEVAAHGTVPLCLIFDWQAGEPIEFASLKGKMNKGMKKFYAVIGNPPYQEEFTDEGNKTYAAPVYNNFMDEAEKVADKVELITPARFLFNAGSTPKAWNTKKLNDSHFKVLFYEEESRKVFPNTDIKGGIAVTLRDSLKQFGAIEVFTKSSTLTSILHKIVNAPKFVGMTSIVLSRTVYRLTNALHKDYPNAINLLSKGHAYDMSTNIFERLPMVFSDTKPNDGRDYIKILGRFHNQRTFKYIRSEYVSKPENLYKYKVVLPSGNGNGNYGEALTAPIIGIPGVGTTETFISIGLLNSKKEAESLLKYIETKFARSLLGVLKTTQHLTPEVWKFVPLQDFTSNSDIDWSQSISDIDQQLYRKYNLSDDEIEFIESHVKEMD